MINEIFKSLRPGRSLSQFLYSLYKQPFGYTILFFSIFQKIYKNKEKPTLLAIKTRDMSAIFPPRLRFSSPFSQKRRKKSDSFSVFDYNESRNRQKNYPTNESEQYKTKKVFQ